MNKLISNAVTNILSFFDLSGSSLIGSAAGDAFLRVMNKRISAARDVLLEELENGKVLPNTVIDEDECVAVTYRYSRAAMEGTARLNLRLLTKSLIGDLNESRLSADRFLYYADVISSLTRAEIHLIAALLKARATTTEDQYYSVAHASTAYEQAFNLLVPHVFRDGLELKVSAAALTRHGLVFSYGGIGGGTTYGLSPLVDEFMSLAEFEDALRKEGIKASGD
ncbi:hypothetical protein ACFOY8_18195 [Thalassospira xianhensis]|uniref:hypothetical protein n=1 Tax=Thalassospira xianhensis TaxID=478503 RepID=UPI0011BD9B40|nr:hypothetical protein [Thalassospira xianhensis]